MPLPTFSEFVAGPWKKVCYNQCKASTRARADSALQTQLLPEFGIKQLNQISVTEIYAWFERYSLTAPGGANRTLDILKQIFNYAIECDLIQNNPTDGLKRNPRLKLTRFLSKTEIKRLHEALDAHRGHYSGRQQVDIIRLLLFTGCRKGELVHLRWSEYHGDMLHLQDSKTGARTVLLNVQSQEILARQPKISSTWVFPSYHDTSKPRSGELSLWRKVRRVAGLDGVRLHDLRHTFASHAMISKIPLPVVMRLLGHSRERMTLRYAHVSDSETEAAAERIGIALDSVLRTGSM
ncbi:MAG: tyrosine-type recombinase/integrase [Bacteroidota bacterium]|nr:tyrosine-type recombinase/integrase [Bacteroidota bacterium]MDE2646133.1 tyrosine-type recombinase/integrase [Bacteroidota bacterium]MXW34068.1 site-specific integrase [Rhodothermaceae bacterium]MYE64045.1 site-specific integrase [Rhodothermaceae bacterium]MYJ21249.1 site-specific integrase [Rhodothermaceae bacterium]